MAVTSMDTTALFHQNICRGSDANQAGLIAFLAAMTALSSIKSTMQKLEKQIIFAAFQGESYDFVGSRKFVHDISGHFTCDEVKFHSFYCLFVLLFVNIKIIYCGCVCICFDIENAFK